MHTILGAGGVIANELAMQLILHNHPVKLVSRNPPGAFPEAHHQAADLTDRRQVQEAVAGSSVVYLCAGLKYDVRVWEEQWPKIMENVIEGCKHAAARLVFFDNVYMYGKVEGAMTEKTPYSPRSKKGEIRAKIATRLMDEAGRGNLRACIARSADFYGPNARTGILNLLVSDRLAKGKKPQWLGDPALPHSYTFTPNAGKALYILGTQDTADNQVWHVPTAAPALTGKEYIQLAANALHVQAAAPIRLNKGMILLGGLFDRQVKELYEMMYQNVYAYVFDSSKFEQAFNTRPTSYEKGIGLTVETRPALK